MVEGWRWVEFTYCIITRENICRVGKRIRTFLCMCGTMLHSDHLGVVARTNLSLLICLFLMRGLESK